MKASRRFFLGAGAAGAVALGTAGCGTQDPPVRSVDGATSSGSCIGSSGLVVSSGTPITPVASPATSDPTTSGSGPAASDPGSASVDPTAASSTEPGAPSEPEYAPVTGEGLVATGVDDTDTIERAVREGLTLGEGAFVYRGSGIDVASPVLRGLGAGRTFITIDSDYLIDSDRQWSSLFVEGVSFTGGRAVIRNRYRGANVTTMHVVRNCRFVGYEENAICHASSDMPYWKITQNYFAAAGSEHSIAVALPGLTDGTTISDNAFVNNRVHIKLGRGGNNTHIQNNDFIQTASGTSRVAVWIVPGDRTVNAGSGLLVDANKFGNEFADSSDLRIAYLDQDGDDFSRAMPSSAISSGYISGHTITGCNFAGNGDGYEGAVVSATPNVTDCYIGPITISGGVPSCVLAFRRSPSEAIRTKIGPVQSAEDVAFCNAGDDIVTKIG
ncbi:hypothetical protein [uncultured Propionibacterium sp.]|uniref:hypothetical protein n=1 Tax=uncultured Propionibacterium sp. TaxID=218066 RepID=UPI00292F22A6|nr:hypothetical protein [uncultured Propionibacterium sp.]